MQTQKRNTNNLGLPLGASLRTGYHFCRQVTASWLGSGKLGASGRAEEPPSPMDSPHSSRWRQRRVEKADQLCPAGSPMPGGGGQGRSPRGAVSEGDGERRGGAKKEVTGRTRGDRVQLCGPRTALPTRGSASHTREGGLHPHLSRRTLITRTLTSLMWLLRICSLTLCE